MRDWLIRRLIMGFSSAFDDVIREIENVNPRECGGNLVEGRIKNDEGMG